MHQTNTNDPINFPSPVTLADFIADAEWYTIEKFGLPVSFKEPTPPFTQEQQLECYRYLVEQVVKMERERCANICEDLFMSDGNWCAQAIRRGE